MDAKKIREHLANLGGYNSIFIPEFTFNDLRIDALVVDLSTRWARGFEIKVTRSDFVSDDKWTRYASFCSSLSIACPYGLIKKEEVHDPFGLLWVRDDGLLHWEKRPKKHQTRRGLAWLDMYTRILEKELPRIHEQAKSLQRTINHWSSRGEKAGE